MSSKLKECILNVSASWDVLLAFSGIGYHYPWNEWQSLTFLTTHHWAWLLWLCHLLSPSDIHSCVLYHIFLIIIEVMLLWSSHVYSCNSTYGKLTQEINWVIFFLAFYLPYGEGARADTSQMISFQGLQLSSLIPRFRIPSYLNIIRLGHQ